MKRLILIILISVGCFTSCDDFLDVTPRAFITPSNFYQSEDDFDRAVAGIYQRNRSLFNSLMWQFGEMRSDNTSFFFNPNDRGGFRVENIDLFLMNTDNGRVAEFWNSLYNGISRCNYVLLQIDDVPFINEENREIRRAEALFLRSWFYFILVQLWSDVPISNAIINTPEEGLTDEFTDTRPAEDVYEFILEDVQTAIDILPQWEGADLGRASRGAALMLKAKMYMALQEFENAIPLLEEMQTLNYGLLDNYADIFDPANKNHMESVFEIQYSFALNQSSNFLSAFVPWNSGTEILGLGQNAGPTAGRNQPTTDIINEYRDTDVRKEVGIANFIVLNDEDDDSDNDTIPYLGKYAFPFEDIGAQDVNWPMFRFADALLMLAESLNEVNALDQNAIGIVNIIRLRAGVPPLSDASNDSSLIVSSQEELRQAIYRERRLELAFENHRWFDLLRTGEAEEVMIAHGIQEEEEKGSTIVVPGAYSNIRTVLPIPFVQVRDFGTEQAEVWR
ncbi:MAG: RagB/SusD family nutrient uptake outer membrane protein [Bacteroidota bacterium]